MVDQPGRLSTWAMRAVVYGGLLAGVALVISAVRSGAPPLWWWLAGVPLTVLCGLLVAVWIGFRLRFRSTEERHRHFAELKARRQSFGAPLDRSRLAHRATRHKKAVLRSGADATAVVTFLADGLRANQFEQLVYLELEITPGTGGTPYQVRTGEFLNAASAGSVSPGRQLYVKVDPADPHRVAVDWERSLRLA